MREHDFSDTVVREIGQSAMLICQNPTCLCFTGYSSVEGRPRRIAEAAHVLPSGSKGPRASAAPAYSQIDPASSGNGLWLCRNCHSEIDGDPSRFPATELFEWKKKHQDLVSRIVGRDLEAALLNLRNDKRYHQEVRDLLSFFDSRRVLYEGMDAEFPPRVLESLDIIRARLVQTRAAINPDSDLFPVIYSLQAAVDRLLRNIGASTDLRLLHCDSRDPKWRKFCDELRKFRDEVSVILRVLAGNSGYKLTYV
jgi:hypothetical protein